MRAKDFDLTLSEEAFEFLLRRGIHKTLEARPLLGVIEKFIGDAICESNAAAGILYPSPDNDRLQIICHDPVS